MQEDKRQLMNYAMYGGVFLGLFWMFKYLFVMGSTRIPALNILGSFLSIGTPLILFYFLVKYKNDIVSNTMGYWHGVQFGIMLFFFASLLEAVIVFVHITWIDQAFVGKLYENMIETVKAMNLSETMVNTLENQPLPTTLNYIFSNVVLTDVFIGLILSAFIVPFARRYTPANRKS
ncbi:hypothetical protein SDC9_199988 [bioreactor metagenome]|uniref:DUF4199 domain-containing protein n=1 Tax=bioreactor metagenome TaxID=1076179 RepID=A0A645INA2_9ZZZZ